MFGEPDLSKLLDKAEEHERLREQIISELDWESKICMTHIGDNKYIVCSKQDDGSVISGLVRINGEKLESEILDEIVILKPKENS